MHDPPVKVKIPSTKYRKFYIPSPFSLFMGEYPMAKKSDNGKKVRGVIGFWIIKCGTKRKALKAIAVILAIPSLMCIISANGAPAPTTVDYLTQPVFG
jgi:hypothetical protein